VEIDNVGFDLKGSKFDIDPKLKQYLVGRVSKLHPTIKLDLRCSWDVSLSWGRSFTLAVTIRVCAIGGRGTQHVLELRVQCIIVPGKWLGQRF
jgi:hypothetical protein